MLNYQRVYHDISLILISTRGITKLSPSADARPALPAGERSQSTARFRQRRSSSKTCRNEIPSGYLT